VDDLISILNAHHQPCPSDLADEFDDTENEEN